MDLLPVLHQSPLPAELQATLGAFDEGADLIKRMKKICTIQIYPAQ